MNIDSPTCLACSLYKLVFIKVANFGVHQVFTLVCTWGELVSFIKTQICSYPCHSSYWSIKWYSGRGILELTKALGGLFIAFVIQIPAMTAMVPAN